MGFLVLIIVASLLSLICLRRYERKWKHACLVAAASYVIMQIGNTIHLGYFDPFFFVGIPIAFGICVGVYYFIYFAASVLRHKGNGLKH